MHKGTTKIYCSRPILDASAKAFISATGLTGATETTAVNNLVIDLKKYGLWSKIKAIYPFVSDQRNLFSYTEDFANVAWSKSNVTITANTTTAPDGTTTASTIQNTGTGYMTQSNLALSANTYTQSIYAKKNNNDWVAIYTSDTGSNYSIAWFNLNTGVKGTASAVGTFSATSSTMTSVGNGWYRCSVTFTKPTTTNTDSAVIIPSGDNTFTRVIGQNAYIWGAQFELSSTVSTYQKTVANASSIFVQHFKYNLKDPVDMDASFRLTFNGGWTYSRQGATSNGTNAYARTYFVPSVHLTAPNQSASLYSRTNVASTSNSFDLSSVTTGVGNFSLNIDAFVAGIKGFVRFGLTQDVRITTAQRNDGYFIGSRTSATMLKLYKSNVILGTTTTADTGISTTEVPLGVESVGGTLSGYSAKQYAFCHMGEGLNDLEANALYTIVQRFQVALNRHVI
jgi:hypothetical protein